MKKLFTILLLLFLSTKISFAQEIFPLSGAKWTEVEENHNYKPIQYKYFSYVLQGDTVIDDILRSKLYYIPDINRRDSVLIGFIHVQESTVVYRIKDERGLGLGPYHLICVGGNIKKDVPQEFPLYDFSLSIGDSFTFNCYPATYPVSNIDDIDLGGISRKRMIFTDKFGYIQDQWIEGMGSVNGLFFGKENKPISASNIWHVFVCFSLNDEVLYLNPEYSECPVPEFNSISVVRTNPLRIFPNPMKSAATIQSSQPLQLIQIYDISGVLLYKQACKGELQTTINKQSLLQGTYLMKVTMQTGGTRTKKLIIQ